MRITVKEQEMRKNRMIHVAYDLFCERGIDGTTLAEISKAAGVSPKSIFRYFENKAELLQHTQIILWEEIVAYILTSSKTQIDAAQSGLAKIEILLANFKTLYENHSRYLVFSCDYKLFLVRNNIKLSQHTYDKIMKPVVEIFTEALEQGREDGSITKDHTISTQFFTMWGVMRGYAEGIAIYDLMYGGNNPWKGQFELLLQYIVAALAAKT